MAADADIRPINIISIIRFNPWSLRYYQHVDTFYFSGPRECSCAAAEHDVAHPVTPLNYPISTTITVGIVPIPRDPYGSDYKFAGSSPSCLSAQLVAISTTLDIRGGFVNICLRSWLLLGVCSMDRQTLGGTRPTWSNWFHAGSRQWMWMTGCCFSVVLYCF